MESNINSSMKLKLQLFPIDDGTRRALEMVGIIQKDCAYEHSVEGIVITEQHLLNATNCGFHMFTG